MGLFVTGDCHGDWWRLNIYALGRDKKLSKDDYLIVCGDFGIWHDIDGYESGSLDELAKLPFTILFVDGNHENFDRLCGGEFEVVDYHGGKAHKIRENIYHLMRGYVFELCGKKIFAFGGASSHDVDDGILDPDEFDSWSEFSETANEWNRQGKMFRIKGYSWWEQELPSEDEMERGRKSLSENDNEVDFIISHCCPQQIASIFSQGLYKADKLTHYFDEILEKTKFTKWYFGHYHDNRRIMGKFIMKYENIEQVA